MDLVPEIELRNALSNRLHEWKLNGDRLERTFQFPSFRAAKDFVDKIADVAERMNHHPDIALTYDKVKLSLWSHDAGGVSRRDLALAGKIQEIAPGISDQEKLKSA